MSSSTWTQGALSSSAKLSSGRGWRFVEAQHRVSTLKLTDTAAEQQRLESLLEDSKPPIPEECRHLDFLLFTPFRYGPYPFSSRFRRTGLTPGVFYASEDPETAASEKAFYRLLFYAESPKTPWPQEASEYTAFAIEYATGRSIDLTLMPFSEHRANWTHLNRYDECQQLADTARQAGIDLIKYECVRRPERAINLAILHCRAFAKSEPAAMQSWHFHFSPSGVRAICDFPRVILEFDRDFFAADCRLSEMPWERPTTIRAPSRRARSS
jgi:hypothetical protein